MPTDFYTYRGDLRGFGGGTPIAFEADPAIRTSALGPLAQGEFVAWGTTDRLLKRFVRAAEAGKFAGITRDSQVGVRKLGNQAALDAATDRVSVFTTGIHELTGTAGQTYSHGDAVYMEGTSTQHVTKVAGGGTQIATVHLPDGTQKSGAVRVPILIDQYTITQA